MEYNINRIFYLILLSLYCEATSDGLFSKNIIAHPETGLFLKYVGLYSPSQTIIHNSAVFPMTTATCHFIPLAAAESIPSCNITGRRSKRGLTSLIALGVGIFSTGLSAANSIQTMHLQRQVAVVEKGLSKFVNTMKIHGAFLAQINSNQIKIIEELDRTQKALTAMGPILNSHTNAIKNLVTGYQQLRLEFSRSFLYSAMNEIFRNQLTLSYLSPDDLHKVVYNVIEKGNLTFNSVDESMPISQIITQLLVRQQMNFIPSSQYVTTNEDEIGRLVITNYFAIPHQKQVPFYVYKLITIPFFDQNKTLTLAQMPEYWGINLTDNNTIEWYYPEESGCNLQLMTTCRDTPPFRTIRRDSCFGEIVAGLSPTKCHTIPFPFSPYYIRQLQDNLVVTSSSKPLHCLKTPKNEYADHAHHSWSMSEEVTLPPVAVVNVTPEYIIACPGFFLSGHSGISNASSLIIFHNNTIVNTNVSVFDISQYLSSNNTRLTEIRNERVLNQLMESMEKPNNFPDFDNSSFYGKWHYISLILSCIVFVLGALVIYYCITCRQNNSLHFV